MGSIKNTKGKDLAGEIATGIQDVRNDLPEEDRLAIIRGFQIAKKYGQENKDILKNNKGKGTRFYFMYLHVTFKE